MKIAVAGGGLVGALLSIFLRNRGYDTTVYEKRKDPRTVATAEGRSINLVLAERGLTALDRVGLKKEMLSISVPLYGRMIHDKNEKTTYLPYGKEGQAIHSISRKQLNEKLLTAAEQAGVKFCFEENITDHKTAFEFCFGADGFGSAIREQLVKENKVHEKITTLDHGYKELSMPPIKGKWALDKNVLHIWPREQFMLIALPNVDGSFTCTLFLQMKGKVSFEALENFKAFERFVKTEFPDAVPYLTTLEEDYKENPVSTLKYIECWPWVGNEYALIGDAAHAIVPFYGQGMNAGFEDCRILDEHLEKLTFDEALQAYQNERKPNADAIKDLSLQNFIEMRDKVADEDFQTGKMLSSQLAELYPESWVPQYSQVTFSNRPYTEAKKNGEEQTKFIDELLNIPGFHLNWLDDASLKAQVSRKLARFFAD